MFMEINMKCLYIISIGIGLIINATVNYYALKSNGIKAKKNFINIIIIQIFTIILGSKILDLFVNYRYYIYYDMFQAISSGYMFYGGVILSICAMIIYCKIEEINLDDMFKAIIPNILLLYAFCKIGCFFNKCCIGIHDFPIQLVESIICFMSYFVILKKLKTLNKVYVSCMVFGIVRFATFLLRSNISVINLIVNEIISVCIVFIGIALFLKERRKE